MNTTKNKHPGKDLKDQGISPKKLLKIALVVLMIVPLGYFLYITLEASPFHSRFICGIDLKNILALTAAPSFLDSDKSYISHTLSG